LNQRSRHGDGGDGDDKGQKPPIRGIFAVIRALKIGHRDTLLSRCVLISGLSVLNYILVYVGGPPNHQNPDHEVKYQRQEDFHRIVSQPVGSLSPFKRSVYTRSHLARVAFEDHLGVGMLILIINVAIIVVIGVICFSLIDWFVRGKQLGNLLKVLVALICLAAVVQRVLPALG
jgi:hypothetical protein